VARRQLQTEMRGLANLTSCFVLAFFVGMSGGLRKESKKYKRQSDNQHSGKVLPPYLLLANHLDFYLPLTTWERPEYLRGFSLKRK
jgi:hypothetical protein